MKQESFIVTFNWQNKQSEIHVMLERNDGQCPVLALYHVYWNESYLFSIFPTFTDLGEKFWDISDKKAEFEWPTGFIADLGKKIDEFYIARYS